MVFENAILFLRDALLSREFTDAIKAGDSGRVVLILKTWALSFRGSGRTKYAHEMLHLIHNIMRVWPKAIRWDLFLAVHINANVFLTATSFSITGLLTLLETLTRGLKLT